eukprot:6134433-Pyramimonas_sp.AAC.1
MSNIELHLRVGKAKYEKSERCQDHKRILFVADYKRTPSVADYASSPLVVDCRRNLVVAAFV